MNPLLKSKSKLRLTPLTGGILVVALLLAVYVGAYAVRSKEGRYEVISIDLGGTQYYRWAPAGFVTNRNWNTSTVVFYYPLYLADIRFWHTSYP